MDNTVAKPLISKKTLNEFQEVFVDEYVLRTIEQEFDAADIEIDGDYCPSVSGQRRTLVQQYYHTLDLSSTGDVKKLLALFESVLDYTADVNRATKSASGPMRLWCLAPHCQEPHPNLSTQLGRRTRHLCRWETLRPKKSQTELRQEK